MIRLSGRGSENSTRRLYSKPDRTAKPDEIARVNEIFKKAADHAGDDSAVLKDLADYYASTQQIKEAIPLYLRLLELEPEDTNAREKLAAGFLLTNQRDKADRDAGGNHQAASRKNISPTICSPGCSTTAARALERDKKKDEAKASFAKAAANYEQSLVVNPDRLSPYLHLAELLLGPLKESERAVKILTEARQHFPRTPEIAYYLGNRSTRSEAFAGGRGHLRRSVARSGAGRRRNYKCAILISIMAPLPSRLVFTIKRRVLFQKSIALDPANAADAYNYLAYMWAEHNLRLDEAEQMIKLALQSDPNNGAYIDTLGWLEYRQGKFDQALVDLLAGRAKIDPRRSGCI